MRRKILKLIEKLRGYTGDYKSLYQQTISSKILVQLYIEHKLLNKKYDDARRLARFEFQSFSQGGEDGIIHEIFNRIGASNRFFVEFGVGNGLQNNSAYLLLNGWEGLWMEPDEESYGAIQEGFRKPIQEKKLRVLNTAVDSDNFSRILRDQGAPPEPDFLSIDIDGNDYWVWKSLEGFRPRVMAVEYNAALGPFCEWKMTDNKEHRWSGAKGAMFGASLKALEKLGSEKGYKLVGCNLTGVNAFFVRDDLAGEDLFCAPFVSENHFEKALYFMENTLGHKRTYEMFNEIPPS